MTPVAELKLDAPPPRGHLLDSLLSCRQCLFHCAISLSRLHCLSLEIDQSHKQLFDGRQFRGSTLWSNFLLRYHVRSAQQGPRRVGAMTNKTQDGMGLLHCVLELFCLTNADGCHRDAVSRHQQDLCVHAQSVLCHCATTRSKLISSMIFPQIRATHWRRLYKRLDHSGLARHREPRRVKVSHEKMQVQRSRNQEIAGCINISLR